MTANFRLLALVTDAFSREGGIAQYNRDLMTAISTRMKNASAQILPRYAAKDVGDLPLHIQQHPARSSKVAYAVTALKLALTSRPNAIFCGHIYTSPLAALLARLAGAKLIVQMHGIDAWEEPSVLQRRAVEQATMVLCVSRYTRARVLDWADIPPERVAVLPNTVAENYTPGDRAAARNLFGLQDQFVLLSVSRLDARESYKGHDRVIPLLPELIAQGKDVLYLIAGDGDDRPRLEALAREHNIVSHVRFLGHVPREDLPNLYRAADLFVLPSTGEGFGIVFLEAMACGTPALGLACGGAVDALCDGELGTAVEGGELGKALVELLANRNPNPATLAASTLQRFGREPFQETAKNVLMVITNSANTEVRKIPA